MAMKLTTEDMGKYFFILAGSLIALQFVALLFQGVPFLSFLSKFRIGIVFYLIIIVGVLWLAFLLAFKTFTLSRAQFFAMLVVLAILIFLLLKIKVLVPQIFSIANVELNDKIMSVFGR